MPLGEKWKNTVLERKIKNLLMADWILNIHYQYLKSLILWELHMNSLSKSDSKTISKIKYLKRSQKLFIHHEEKI